MNHRLEMDLMRLLHGELPETRARELRARMEGDVALAAAYRRLEAAWRGLDLPPAAPPTLGFAGRVMAEVRESARDPLAGSLGWTLAPAWARAAAAAALVAGLAAGVGLGGVWSGGGLEATDLQSTSSEEAELAEVTEGSLADSYWATLEETEEPGVPEPAASEVQP